MIPFSCGLPDDHMLLATRITFGPIAARRRCTKSLLPAVQLARSVALIPDQAPDHSRSPTTSRKMPLAWVVGNQRLMWSTACRTQGDPGRMSIIGVPGQL